MKILQKSKRKISILLLILISISSLLNIFITYAEPATRVTAQQVVNGSPLLNDSWIPDDTNDLTKEDHIAFALYLSANTYPFVDNYLTAFFENQGGTNGSSKDRVVFRTSDNPIIEKYITAFASYHQDLQGVGGTAIGTASSITFYDLNARLSDLIGSDGKPNNTGNIIQYNLTKDDGTTVTKTIYDPSKEKDKIGLAIGYATSFKAYKDSTKEFIKYNSNQPLYLDMFGNVVCAVSNMVIGTTTVDTGYSKTSYTTTKKMGSAVRIVFPNYLNPNIMGGKICLFSDFVTGIIRPQASKTGAEGDNIILRSIELAQTFANDTIEFRYGGDGFFGADLVKDLKLSGTEFINQYYWLVNSSYTPAQLFKKANNDCYLCDFFTNGNWTAEGRRYILNKHVFLNYILLAFGQFYNQTLDGSEPIKIDTDYFSINVTQLNGIIQNIDNTSTEDKQKGIIDTIYGFFTTPLSFVNFLASIFQGIFVWLYGVCLGLSGTSIQNVNTLGFNTVQELPFISGFFYFLNTYTNVVFGFVFLICMIIALFKRSPSVVIKFLFTIFLIMLLPGILNYITFTANNLITKAFSSQQNSWILQFNKEFEKKDLGPTNTNSQAVLYEQNNFNSNATLKYIVEKSPVVLNNTSNEMVDILSGSGWGYLFLNSILRQYKTHNIISSSAEDLFKKFSLLKYSKIDSTNVSQFLAGSLVSSNYYDRLFYPKSKAAVSGNITDGSANFQANLDSSTGTQWSFPTHLKDFPSLTQTNENGEEVVIQEAQLEYLTTGDLHNNFYYLPENVMITTNNPYSAYQSVSQSGLENVYTKYFTDINSEVNIPKFNFYDNTKYDSGYGYFILTENTIPYFYMVFRDLFRDEVNHRQIGYQLQGEVVSSSGNSLTDLTGTNDRANEVTLDQSSQNLSKVIGRNSILMSVDGDKQNIVDYVDLRTLFKKVAPYCYATTLAARNLWHPDSPANKDKKDKEQFKIGSDYGIYKGNDKYWLFDCRWATVLYDLYYEDSSLVSAKDANSFCPGEVNYDTNITDFEHLCADFYYKLTPQIEELISHINDDNMNNNILIRQMAMITALQFNKSFSMGNNTIEPRYIDPGSISLDSLYKDVILASGYKNSDKNAAEMITDNWQTNFFSVVMLFFSAFAQMILSWVKTGGMILCVALCIIVLVFRIMSDSNQDYFNTVIGVFALYTQLLFYSYIGILVTLLLSLSPTDSTIWRASDLPLNIKLAFIALASIMSCKLVISTLIDATGFSMVNGKLSWDPNTFFQLGGNKVRERLGNGLTAGVNGIKKGLGWMVKGAAIPTVGGVVGGGLAAAHIATGGASTAAIGKGISAVASTIKSELPGAIKDAAIQRFTPQIMRNPAMARLMRKAFNMKSDYSYIRDDSGTSTNNSSTDSSRTNSSTDTSQTNS